MLRSIVHTCECSVCESGPSEETASVRAQHHQMNLFLSRLSEQQRRWYAALESKRLGHGGDRQICRITGLSEKTIRRGRRELDAELASCPADRVRREGGGRPAVEVRDPVLEKTLEEIVAPETAGDPMGGARYKRSSLRHLSARLAEEGHPASPASVRRLLRKLGYSPRVNARRKGAKSPPPSVMPSSATSSSRSATSSRLAIR